MLDLNIKNQFRDFVTQGIICSSLLGLVSLASGCGTSTPQVVATPSAPVTAATAAATAGTALSIQSYNPASGTTTLPTIVTIIFSEALASSASTPSYWSYACTAASAASSTPTNVTINGSIATVTLPSVSAQTSASSCTLTLSTSIVAASGNTLSTAQTVVYGAASTTTTNSFVGFINYPVPNSFLTKSVTLSASVYDAFGTTIAPSKVQFLLGTTSGSSVMALATLPFGGLQSTYSFDTTTVPNGTYTIHVYAYDASGVQYTDIATPVSVSISNLTGNLATLCAQYHGVSVLAAGTAICQVPLSACPVGMLPHGDGNWTTTSNVSCNGGSTWGCGATHSGDTGSHSIFQDLAPETVSVPTLAACGPATQGSRTCSATVVSIGCVAQYN